jgi:hypothetical protein
VSLPSRYFKGRVSSSACISDFLSRQVILIALLLGTIGLCRPGYAGGTQRVGVLLNTTNASPGYTLFSAISYANTYLIDNEGQLVHRWTADHVPGNSQYLRDNGNLVRTADPGSANFLVGGDAGLVEEYDWEGSKLWEFLYSDTTHRAHHDIAVLPNGNVLIIAWELKTSAEAIAAGRDPGLLVKGELWPDHVIEIQPDDTNTPTIVWEWHAWDHLIQDFDVSKTNFGVVGDHPELIDLNYVQQNGRADWLHINAIDYNDSLDQVLLCVPRFNELWIIDHSTTTAEAAGHSGGNSGRGGDLLYRWGNPRTYGAGTTTNQQFFFQHDTHWIPTGLPGEGNILIFNNGIGRSESIFSTVEELVTPVDTNGNYALVPGTSFGPAVPTWNFTATPPGDLFSGGISGADRQPNGNTLICEGFTGEFFEVTATSNLVWHYVNPVVGTGPINQGQLPLGNAVFRANRYTFDFPGFAGRNLTPKGPVELDPNAVFILAEVTRTSTGMRISWVSTPDSTYHIRHTPSLAPPIWDPIATNLAVGTLTTFSDTNPGRIGQSGGVYSVVEVQ